MLRMTKDNKIASVSFTLIAPFITYLVAESFHVSGVIAVVVLGIFITMFTKTAFPSETKLLSKNIWDMITFFLNGFIFLILGLNFTQILEEIPSEHIGKLIGYGFLIAIGALLIRMGVIFFDSWWRQRRYLHKPTEERSKQRISRQSALVLSRSGMRGIVSLAIALGLPLYLSDGSPFPERNIIIFISIVVVLITLIIQGIGLPYLVKYLNITKQQQQ